MKLKLQLFATLFLVAGTFVSKAQSVVTFKNLNKELNLNTNTLNSDTSGKWSESIKQYFLDQKKAQRQTISLDNKDVIIDYKNNIIDGKMVLLINKNSYLDTDFRMPNGSEDIDLKMIYPNRGSKPNNVP
ncbi:hypothetical protein [Pedobacter alpinus]|uniref:Uncharacterized protein n=1 Tax=Pedobacter alpinus TaxID=1590643 RepID=A0ABW5TPI2_9SPHI